MKRIFYMIALTLVCTSCFHVNKNYTFGKDNIKGDYPQRYCPVRIHFSSGTELLDAGLPCRGDLPLDAGVIDLRLHQRIRSCPKKVHPFLLFHS